MKIGPISPLRYLFICSLTILMPYSNSDFQDRLLFCLHESDMTVATAHMLLNVYRLNFFYFGRGSLFAFSNYAQHCMSWI